MKIHCPSCQGEIDLASIDDLARIPCPACHEVFGLGPQRSDPTFEMLAPGTRIGNVEVIEPIGQGGMSVVYRARQVSLDRVVALKVLASHLAGDAQFVERFDREARTLAGLDHPNVVKVIDRGEEGGRCYFVMEYVEGENLRQRMRRKRLTPDRAVDVARAIAAALEAAHARGIVHRDVKPENVLIDRAGHVRVTDFGISKLLRGDHRVDPYLTRTNILLGTIEYMAPEQRDGARNVDHRADLYALGVVLYEMLTGERPVGRFDPPSARAAPQWLDSVVMRLLDRDPARRFGSAAELLAALEGGGAASGSGNAVPASEWDRLEGRVKERVRRVGERIREATGSFGKDRRPLAEADGVPDPDRIERGRRAVEGLVGPPSRPEGPRRGSGAPVRESRRGRSPMVLVWLAAIWCGFAIAHIDTARPYGIDHDSAVWITVGLSLLVVGCRGLPFPWRWVRVSPWIWVLILWCGFGALARSTVVIYEGGQWTNPESGNFIQRDFTTWAWITVFLSVAILGVGGEIRRRRAQADATGATSTGWILGGVLIGLLLLGLFGSVNRGDYGDSSEPQAPVRVLQSAFGPSPAIVPPRDTPPGGLVPAEGFYRLGQSEKACLPFLVDVARRQWRHAASRGAYFSLTDPAFEEIPRWFQPIGSEWTYDIRDWGGGEETTIYLHPLQHMWRGSGAGDADREIFTVAVLLGDPFAPDGRVLGILGQHALHVPGTPFSEITESGDWFEVGRILP